APHRRAVHALRRAADRPARAPRHLRGGGGPRDRQRAQALHRAAEALAAVAVHGLHLRRRRRAALAADLGGRRARRHGHGARVAGAPVMEEKTEPDVVALFWHFLLLACVSIGGTDTVLPDIHRYLVEVNQWITNRQFADAYALARAVPGPNMLYVTLMGYQAAGVWGALATTLALAVPPFTFTLLVMHLSTRYPGSRLGRAFRVGFAPITIGLMFSSGWVLVNSVNHDLRGYLVTAGTV